MATTAINHAVAIYQRAIAMVIPIDIMRVLNNHYSMVNQRAIATVKQWLHWKPLQRRFQIKIYKH